MSKAEVKVMQVKDIQRCPFLILVPRHYRDDGSCRCDDRLHTEMAQWGYRWSKQKQRWVSL